MAGGKRIDGAQGTFLKAAAAVFTASMLGACSSMGDFGAAGGGGTNYAANSPADARLSGADRDALGDAFRRAMETGTPQTWRGSNAVGAVTPANFAVANLKADPQARINAARGDFDLAHSMETEMGLHVLTRNSNIRTGPATDAKVAEVLPSGTGVDVVGRVADRNWLFVAVDQSIRGYVFGDLVVEAPGTELELAGGPMRRPVLCRNFVQRVNIYSDRYEWTGAACNDGSGWRLAEEPVDENAPQSLLDY